MKKSQKKEKPASLVERFLKQNPSIKLQTADFQTPRKIEGYNWRNLKRQKSIALQELKSWQRLSRVLPDDKLHLIPVLFQHGIHSALQIAAISKQEFLSKFKDVFEQDELLLEQTHRRARAIRSQVMLKYIEKVQNKEPHFKRANFS